MTHIFNILLRNRFAQYIGAVLLAIAAYTRIIKRNEKLHNELDQLKAKDKADEILGKRITNFHVDRVSGKHHTETYDRYNRD